MNETITPNTTIGDYTVVSKLGEGGMGEVWRARDPKLVRDVAIKVLPPEYSSNAERLNRFEQEAQAAGSLNHPNILVIYHIGTHQGSPYIVSELLEGATLRDQLNGTALPQRKALDYALQIAVGLAAAHEKGIIHRDIKPENVFVTSDGRIKILDFGLAKLSPSYDALEGQTEIPTRRVNTDPGTVVGTLGYMSPEQLKGQPVDHRSDIFSLGTILYEMISGKPAFRGESVAETMSAILREEPSELSETNKSVSPPLERVVRHCLEKNPTQRFHSARDLAFALQEISSQSWRSGDATEQIAALKTTEAKRAPRWVKYTAAALALILLTAIAYLAYKSFSSGTAEKEMIRFAILLPEKTSIAIDVEQHNVSISPDGRHVAFIGVADGQQRVYIRSMDEPEVRLLQGTERAYSPFWSPDSRFVAFFADGKLKKISVTGGPSQTICDVLPQDTTGTWAADGTILFYSGPIGPGGSLFQVKAGGGTPTPFLDSTGVNPSWVTFLPNSHNFLFHGKGPNQPKGIYAGSIGSKEIKLLAQVPETRIEYTPGYLLYVRDGTLVAQLFDADRLSLSGEPKILVERVAYFDKTGFAEFSVSQTGNLVYIADFFVSKMVWLDRAGREQGRVGNPDRFSVARLSPDGKQIAATIVDSQTSSGDLWIYDLNGGRSRFAFGATDDSDAVWSPDGKRIAYFTNGPSSLRIKNVADASGSGEMPIEKGFIGASDWSRDGRYLLYALNEPNVQRDIWVLPFDGDRKPFPFLQTQANEHGGTFSPDGKFVAFNSDESGTMEVYVAPFDKPAQKTRVSVSGGSGPRWHPNGRELFYLSADSRVMAVSFTPGASPTMGIPEVLFPTSELFDYNVSPDGQRFLAVTGAGGSQTAAALRVILNWQTLAKPK